MPLESVAKPNRWGRSTPGRTPILLLLLSMTLGNISAAAPVEIAVVSDDSALNRVTRAALEQELETLNDSEFTYRLLPSERFAHEGNAASARQAVQRALGDDRADIVIALDLIASSVAASVTPDKPLVAASVIQPELQGFAVTESGSSASDNLHFLTTSLDFAGAVREFQRATRSEQMALLLDPALLDAVPAIDQLVEQLRSQLGFALTVVPYSPDVGLSAEASQADALFVAPHPRLSGEDTDSLIEQAIAARIPTFSALGRSDVLAGFLMGRSLVIGPDQLARRLAIDIRDLTLGRSARDLIVTVDVRDRLVINRRTAEAIGFEPSFELIFASEILNEDLPTGRLLTLRGAVDEALERNLQRELAGLDLSVAQEDARSALGSLLPQIGGDVSWLDQDRDLAGTGPTRTTQVGLGLTQTVYSETLLSNYRVQTWLEQARVADLAGTELDVIENVALTYLGVLIAKTERDIQLENLDLTRANLERARFRYDVGATNRSEVFRFETELGTDQQNVTLAQAAYDQQRFELNRILRQPINLPFQLDESGIESPRIFGDPRLSEFFDGPGGVETLGAFLAEEALINAPELASIRAEMGAQERLLLAAKRRRYVPTVTAVGEVSEIVSDADALFETDFDRDWSIGIEASWALFEGGAIRAEQRRAAALVQSLQFTFNQSADIIETRARSAVADAVATRLNIGFATATAAAAQSTLELVTDSYVRGSSSYIDLIDAQNAFISARLAAANAVYEHLQNLIQLQRSVSYFDFAVSASRSEAFIQRLLSFAQAREGAQR